MSTLNDVKKLRVIGIETDTPAGAMEPVALYNPDGTPFSGGSSEESGPQSELSNLPEFVKAAQSAPDDPYTHTFTADDATASDSWFGPNNQFAYAVEFTVEENGMVFLPVPPPLVGGTFPEFYELDYYIFTAGSLRPDGQIDGDAGYVADSYVYHGGALGDYQKVKPDTFTAVADTTYVACLYVYGNPTGATMSFRELFLALQLVGGSPTAFPWNVSSGLGSNNQGYGGRASGDLSVTEGGGTATGDYAHGEGTGIANGDFSHAEGSYTVARNRGAHSEGQSTKADGLGAHSEGGFTGALADYSHAEGKQTFVTAPHSHIEGYGGQAINPISHVRAGSANNFNYPGSPSNHVSQYTSAETVLYSYGGGVGEAEFPTKPMPNTFFVYRVMVAVQSSDKTKGAGFIATGCGQADENSVITLVGTPTVTKIAATTPDPNWTVGIVPGSANPGLGVRVNFQDDDGTASITTEFKEVG